MEEMKIRKIGHGLKLVGYAKHEDERGEFVKTFDFSLFESLGIPGNIAEIATSRNRKGVVRGLHYQQAPCAQGKLVRVVRGSIFDVCVELANTANVVCVALHADENMALWVPEGFAHGFMALEEGTELQYLLTSARSARHERGIRWNDPSLGVRWPTLPPIVNERDAGWPLLRLTHNESKENL